MAPSSSPDSRLLSHLLKAEKDAQHSFEGWTSDASTASAALSAWAVADSGSEGGQELMNASLRISSLLSVVAASQKDYLVSLASYRTALKSVLAREASLRVVQRDREILVSSLLKLSSRKVAPSSSDAKVDAHQGKLEDARRELAACESHLKAEQEALKGMKRRIFREALGMRMIALGRLGEVLTRTSGEALELLEQLGVGTDPVGNGEWEYHHQGDDNDSILGSSAAGSVTKKSASKKGKRAKSPLSARSDTSDSEEEPPRSIASPIIPMPAPHRLTSSSSIPTSLPFPPVQERPVPAVQVPQAPRAVLAPAAELSVPKAPSNVMGRFGEDSSDDEALPPPRVHHSQSTTSNRLAQSAGPRMGQDLSLAVRHSAALQRSGRQAMSESGSITGGQEARKRKSSFFGGLAGLFSRKKKDVSSPPASPTQGGWNTRTDRALAASTAASRVGRGRRDSSSEDEYPTQTVRHVNSPAAIRALALPPPSPARPAKNPARPSSVLATASPGGGKIKKGRKAASDSGLPSATSTPQLQLQARGVSAFTELLNTPTVEKEEPKLVRKISKKPRPEMGDRRESGMSEQSWATARTEATLQQPGQDEAPKKVVKKKASKIAGLGAVSEEAPAAEKEKERKRKSSSHVPAPVDLAERQLAGAMPSASAGRQLGTLSVSTPASPVPPRSSSKEETQHGGSLMRAVEQSAGEVKKKKSVKKAAAAAGEEDDDEGRTSRRYSAGAADGGASKGGETVVLTIDTATNSYLSPTGATTKRRKSVRLADAPDLSPIIAHSPPASVRSDQAQGAGGRAASVSPVPKGALVHHPAETLPTVKANGLPAATEWTSSRGAASGYETSSDEDEEYKKARKAFGKATKRVGRTLSGEESPKKDKGKGKAVEQ